MANLTPGETFGNYTELLYNNVPVAARGNKTGRIYEICKRCGGSGHYSFNLMDGTVCYGCNGNRVTGETTEADAIRKAENRAKARDRRAAKAEAEAAKAREVIATWREANAELVAALEPFAIKYDAEGYVAMADSPVVNSFLADLASQANYRPLSPKQIEAAWAALQRQADKDAQKAAQKATRQAAGHVGTVGEKIETTVKVLFVKDIENVFNGIVRTSWLVTMETAEGNVLKSFSTGAFVDEALNIKGTEQTVTITATVKDHTEYNGEPQTMIKLVKIKK